MAENEMNGTVGEFLRAHPQATLDMMTPVGYVCLTPELGAALLDGGQAYAHPGVSGSEHLADAVDILEQTFCTLVQDENNPDLFHALTDFPEETLWEEAATPQLGIMQM